MLGLVKANLYYWCPEERASTSSRGTEEWFLVELFLFMMPDGEREPRAPLTAEGGTAQIDTRKKQPL
jgi:hypothetical protein